MAQISASITEAFDAFVKSLEEERYYDAHEDLEAIWFPRRFEENDEVKLWKGFINASVSFELIKRGRPGPSEKAWGNYLKYRVLLEQIDSLHYPMYVTIAQMIETRHEMLCRL